MGQAKINISCRLANFTNCFLMYSVFSYSWDKAIHCQTFQVEHSDSLKSDSMRWETVHGNPRPNLHVLVHMYLEFLSPRRAI